MPNMTAFEARTILRHAPRDEKKKSRFYPRLTQAQAVEIIEKAIESKQADTVLDELFEKRVRQCFCDRRRV